MNNSAGKGQGLAIDNLSFSAQAAPVLSAQATPDGVAVTWSAVFTGYTLQKSSDLSQPGGWTDVTGPVAESGGVNTVTVPLSNAVEFFRLRQ
jgi:hypothetical protein